MPILSRKSIHSERNCATVNIPFLECADAILSYGLSKYNRFFFSVYNPCYLNCIISCKILHSTLFSSVSLNLKSKMTITGSSFLINILWWNIVFNLQNLKLTLFFSKMQCFATFLTNFNEIYLCYVLNSTVFIKMKTEYNYGILILKNIRTFFIIRSKLSFFIVNLAKCVLLKKMYLSLYIINITKIFYILIPLISL